jgi:hypothetical protein
MTLQVIGAGLGRTGTMSLKLALEQLGIGRCHHMIEVFAAAEQQVPLWVAAASGRPDWDATLAGFGAVVDYPGCTYWRELAGRYPDARIILSVRDPDKWFDSVSETIFSPAMLGRMLDSPMRDFFMGNVVGSFFDHIGDRAWMTGYFRRWNEAVIEAVAPERLLVFEAADGWEPLCAFLGVPVPDAPYPRVNSRDEMRARLVTPDDGSKSLQDHARERIEQMRRPPGEAGTAGG